MVAVRALSRRVARLERAGKPRPSPIVRWYGTFDAFVEQTYAEIVAGKLCREDMIIIVEVLRKWESDGIWQST